VLCCGFDFLFCFFFLKLFKLFFPVNAFVGVVGELSSLSGWGCIEGLRNKGKFASARGEFFVMWAGNICVEGYRSENDVINNAPQKCWEATRMYPQHSCRKGGFLEFLKRIVLVFPI